MKNNTRLTLTIGIPAHNEEQNIHQLLHSLLRQKHSNYLLEKIIVLCDGCTDSTEFIVKKLTKVDSRIIVMNDRKRKGKADRLNELYQVNTSDILVTIDGDVFPGNTLVIDELMSSFDDENVVLAGANSQPFPAEKFQEKMINIWHRFWYEVRNDINKGNTIHNIQGAFTAIRGSFAKHISFPADTITTGQYLYFSAFKQKMQFSFVKKAIVYFYSPVSIKEYLLQINRYSGEKGKHATIFGTSIYQQYHVPFGNRLKAFFRILRKKPIYAPFIVAFYIHLRFAHSKTTSLKNDNLWKTVHSTKRSFHIVNLPQFDIHL